MIAVGVQPGCAAAVFWDDIPKNSCEGDYYPVCKQENYRNEIPLSGKPLLQHNSTSFLN